jgi:hypothetical protein
MSQLVILGLLIQAVAVTLLIAVLRRTCFRHVGAIFVMMAVLYHGVGELFIAIFPTDNPYRSVFDPKYLGQFVLLVSGAILVFTVVYLSALGGPSNVIYSRDTSAAALTKRIFDYRILLLLTGPLLVLTLGGHGYGSNGGLAGGSRVGTTLGLTQQFFILGIVLAGFGLIMRFGERWILPVLIVQSFILALIGERLIILTGAILLIYGLSRFGLKMGRRQVVIGLVLLAGFGWAISAARGAEGRYVSTSGAPVRLTFMTTGLRHLFSASTGNEIAYTLGYRLDGNSYGAMSLQALGNGSSPVGLTPLKNDVLLAIPSFLNPRKDQSSLDSRSEKLYVEEHLPLPELQTSAGVYSDILPTELGGLIGIIGPSGLIFAAVALGVGFGVLDRWLSRSLGPGRMLVALGALYSVLSYEGSWDTYTTTARGILVLVALMVPILVVKKSVERAYPQGALEKGWTTGLPAGTQLTGEGDAR